MSSTQRTRSGSASTSGRSRFTTTGSCPERTRTHDSVLVGARVDLLVGHVGRHEDEVPGPGIGDELQALAPAHARPAADDVDHALDGPVMMGSGLRVGLDVDRPRPELLGAGPRGGDRGRAAHAGRLGRVRIELAGAHDAHAVQAPVGPRPCPKYGAAIVRAGTDRRYPGAMLFPATRMRRLRATARAARPRARDPPAARRIWSCRSSSSPAGPDGRPHADRLAAGDRPAVDLGRRRGGRRGRGARAARGAAVRHPRAQGRRGHAAPRTTRGSSSSPRARSRRRTPSSS